MPRIKKQRLKQRADGRYCCKYHGIQFMGNSSDEALDARDEYKRREAEGLSMRPLSVAEYAGQWLPLHKGNVSVKCYNDYAKQLETMCAVIGRILLSNVSVDDAAAVWTNYKGYSQSTVKRAKMLFVGLFDAAIENGYCIRNPFRSKFAQPPKAEAGSHRALTEEEITLIQKTPHRFQAPVMVMLYAGLRRGEVLALTSRDIDFKAGVIHVTKAVRYDSNQPIIDKPKTAAGVRDVPILSPLRPILKNRIGRIAESAHGEIMSERAFRRAWDSYLLALSNAAGHPVSIRPHDLRHTYCTMLRDAGVDMKQAMIWMGHADEKMILRIYDHVGEKRTQNSVKQVEKMLNGMQNGMQNASHEA